MCHPNWKCHSVVEAADRVSGDVDALLLLLLLVSLNGTRVTFRMLGTIV